MKKNHIPEHAKEFLKAYASDKNEYFFYMQLFIHGVLSLSMLDRMQNGALTDCDKENLQIVNEIYKKANIDLLAPLFKRLSRNSRKTLFYTAEKSPLERYIFSIVYNLKKQKKPIYTEAIIDIIRKYKGIKIDNDKERSKIYILVRRIRNRVNYRLRKEREEAKYEG